VAARYRGTRTSFERRVHRVGPAGAAGEQPTFVVYEPGKCILCGLCVQIATAEREPLGLAFIGRGFDVRVDVPFDGTIAEGLSRTAQRCAEACPTGALVLRVGFGCDSISLGCAGLRPADREDSER
jgi:predicted molibdopterin-dependent oxidoreductase YjgC